MNTTELISKHLDHETTPAEAAELAALLAADPEAAQEFARSVRTDAALRRALAAPVAPVLRTTRWRWAGAAAAAAVVLFSTWALLHRPVEKSAAPVAKKEPVRRIVPPRLRAKSAAQLAKADEGRAMDELEFRHKLAHFFLPKTGTGERMDLNAAMDWLLAQVKEMDHDKDLAGLDWGWKEGDGETPSKTAHPVATNLSDRPLLSALRLLAVQVDADLVLEPPHVLFKPKAGLDQSGELKEVTLLTSPDFLAAYGSSTFSTTSNGAGIVRFVNPASPSGGVKGEPAQSEPKSLYRLDSQGMTYHLGVTKAEKSPGDSLNIKADQVGYLSDSGRELTGNGVFLQPPAFAMWDPSTAELALHATPHDQRVAKALIEEQSGPRETVHIMSKFVSIQAASLPPEWSGRDGWVVNTDEEFQILMTTMSQTRGLNLLTAPSVMTRPGQLAVVNIGQEGKNGIFAGFNPERQGGYLRLRGSASVGGDNTELDVSLAGPQSAVVRIDSGQTDQALFVLLSTRLLSPDGMPVEVLTDDAKRRKR